MDKLPVLLNLAFTEGSSAKIFKAIADPPTTSLQRLKGLTTGGLPTFVDVGNSFGAPAIVEDNLIHQLVSNGKRVVMMGDDTWVQLFPDHFNKSYPYPSFNVKDLDTVDNGCNTHIFESLHEEDWDVLIAHFLGVDHAGHIFGVDSMQMIEKLEQYNEILELGLLYKSNLNRSLNHLPTRFLHKVIETLVRQSGPGGLHENTVLLVMGDHGQTLNGDHGGGSAEEVETTLFAMGFKQPPSLVPHEFDSSSCLLDSVILPSEQISTLQRLSRHCLVFPFLLEVQSIGSVNAELYALAAGTWNWRDLDTANHQHQSVMEKWMKNYVNTLCTNSWQWKKGKLLVFCWPQLALVKLRYSIMRKEMLVEAILFLLLVLGLRFTIEIGMSKQAATSAFMHASSSWITGIALGYCITRLQNTGKDANGGKSRTSSFNLLAVTQWNLLAVCLFFASGHWQECLPSIDIVVYKMTPSISHTASMSKRSFFSGVLLMAFAMVLHLLATTVTATILCVTIQRRHLMVWGLFAPKFVFDVVGLTLTEVIICLASLLYFRRRVV
ncbi:unnamed protein product [Linum tenue]|uniref:GPI ethanolamine phosphate transferase 3 n=1 Tax=Linum tenue TaxID=586396 RepID=A0AAV0L3Z8_9ROSI|nr:unnamed protein product [Linum tenue]